ncbi:hypothetical protein H6F86_05495 [Phormidium sp. FACHB-592]|uniref:Uncharacterized protein n=1 Tax=Stenomitos frigidus AS-A4 TaxID=2933935 RepID=A0ABV0KP21_9CYAN|nr:MULTISPECIES: hypothetical protein [Cyanophyceae]MBD2033567.1 hypothetical protein [Leptolyngbya sp. FACHB-321]MBD2073346.1 hypothetical protein [Phormidium sp. FACHB-592]
MTSISRTSKDKNTKSKPRVIKAQLEHKADQERFDGFVQMSGLSQAEYIRRCCLEPAVTVIPDSNVLVYAELSKLQGTLTQAVQGESSEAVRSLLSNALQEVKTMRLALLGMEPQETASEELLRTEAVSV